MIVPGDLWGDVHAAFAEPQPVRYTGAGLADAPLSAVKSEVPASDFQGPGAGTLRKVSFEVPIAALPGRPRKGNRLVEDDGAGEAWTVNQAERRADIGAWVLIVEEAQ